MKSRRIFVPPLETERVLISEGIIVLEWPTPRRGRADRPVYYPTTKTDWNYKQRLARCIIARRRAEKKAAEKEAASK